MQNMMGNQHPQQGMHPAYGDFFNDPTAQMAFQVGGRATEAAGAYVEQNVGFPTFPLANGRARVSFHGSKSGEPSSWGNICKLAL